MTVGEKIRERRIMLEMTQDELAQKIGYKSRSSIQKIECSRELPLKKVRQFASALDLSVSYLMGWEDVQNFDFETQEFGAKEPDNYYIDDKAAELAEFLHKNQEYSVLFDASRKVKPEDIKKALAILNAFNPEE